MAAARRRGRQGLIRAWAACSSQLHAGHCPMDQLASSGQQPRHSTAPPRATLACGGAPRLPCSSPRLTMLPLLPCAMQGPGSEGTLQRQGLRCLTCDATSPVPVGVGSACQACCGERQQQQQHQGCVIAQQCIIECSRLHSMPPPCCLCCAECAVLCCRARAVPGRAAAGAVLLELQGLCLFGRI